MSVLVVGSSEPVGALSAALTDSGVAAEVQMLDSAAASVESLTEALVELERAVGDLRPRAIVALGGDDVTTAAALVAGKAGIPLLVSTDPSGESNEARASGVLSQFTFEFPHDGPAVTRAAGEIAASLAGPAGAS